MGRFDFTLSSYISVLLRKTKDPFQPCQLGPTKHRLLKICDLVCVGGGVGGI